MNHTIIMAIAIITISDQSWIQDWFFCVPTENAKMWGSEFFPDARTRQAQKARQTRKD